MCCPYYTHRLSNLIIPQAAIFCGTYFRVALWFYPEFLKVRLLR
jgi:hypothetical protein